MTEREFLNRVLDSANDGANLDAHDHARMDAFLEATAGVSRLVAHSDEDELSLAWRSELNEKLRSVARPVKKPWYATSWRPATALGVTAALFLTFVLQSRTARSGELEQSLIELHIDTERSFEMAGVGVAMPEVTAHHSAGAPDDVGFEQVDLELL